VKSRQTTDDITVAVTGTAWMGSGVGSVQSAIEDLLAQAENEIQLAIYELTKGAEGFLDKLNSCLARGIRTTIVINRYRSKPAFVKQKLERMRNQYPHLSLLSFEPEPTFEDLHAKIIVIDRRKALVGSANLTWKGLVGNHELAVVFEGNAAGTVANLLDKLCADPRVEEA
jgi:phosphatidylserine/phosphatidylglycerophosphate/cardiolipin synthase-like enzyme